MHKYNIQYSAASRRKHTMRRRRPAYSLTDLPIHRVQDTAPLSFEQHWSVEKVGVVFWRIYFLVFFSYASAAKEPRVVSMVWCFLIIRLVTPRYVWFLHRVGWNFTRRWMRNWVLEGSFQYGRNVSPKSADSGVGYLIRWMENVYEKVFEDLFNVCNLLQNFWFF